MTVVGVLLALVLLAMTILLPLPRARTAGGFGLGLAALLIVVGLAGAEGNGSPTGGLDVLDGVISAGVGGIMILLFGMALLMRRHGRE